VTREPTDPHEAALARFKLAVDAHASDTVLDLDEAALSISGVLQPALDIDAWLTELDELAASCPSPTREGVVRHLFATGRFTGDRRTYNHWHNSCLDHVISTGHGIPITLAVVTIEVARRIGVHLEGVGMPAHFLVGDPADGEWFLDPFHDGAVLDRDGCKALFTTIAGDGDRWRDSFLQPTPKRAVLVRMLNNLKAAFTRTGDRVRLAQVMRLRMAMPEITGEETEAVRALAVLN
jgi:regulator of sirC expression with transglutaminase-like and TPR domain